MKPSHNATRPARSGRTRGFTLMELLVVKVVIGVLMSLLLPAVQKIRGTAQQVACANNLKQIGLAMANYEVRNRHYPPSWKETVPVGNQVDGWSAQALLLPYLEQTELHSQVDFSRSYNLAADVVTADGVQTRLSAMRVPTYLCPSESRDEVRYSGGQPEHYPINYAVNLGVWFVYDPATREGGSGAFYPNSQLKSGSFQDGLTFTLCSAEVKAWNPYYRNAARTDNSLASLPSPASICSLGGDHKKNSGHTEWVDGRAHQTGFTTTFPPNTEVLCDASGATYDVDWTNQQEGKSSTVRTYAAVTARSYHGGGVNTVMMDGSVHWFSNDVDWRVWQAYSTREGHELLPSDQKR